MKPLVEITAVEEMFEVVAYDNTGHQVQLELDSLEDALVLADCCQAVCPRRQSACSRSPRPIGSCVNF